MCELVQIFNDFFDNYINQFNYINDSDETYIDKLIKHLKCSISIMND